MVPISKKEAFATEEFTQSGVKERGDEEEGCTGNSRAQRTDISSFNTMLGVTSEYRVRELPTGCALRERNEERGYE